MMKKKILLLEDEMIQQRIMNHILETDYDLEVVSNGSEALMWLQNNNSPDLIIMDWIMPIMDGKSFLQHIKDSMAFLSIPIIVLSSYERVNQEIDEIPYTAFCKLCKPVNPSLLKNSISSIFKNDALQ